MAVVCFNGLEHSAVSRKALPIASSQLRFSNCRQSRVLKVHAPPDDRVPLRGVACGAHRDPGPVRAGHVPGTAESMTMGSSLTGAMVSRVM